MTYKLNGNVPTSAHSAGPGCPAPGYEAADSGWLIRLITALAVGTVAAVAAVISYRHAYELVSAHGEAGITARLVPLTVDGLIVAASMLTLDASRRNQPVPALARWCLGTGIMATIGANLAHGLGHGPIGALVSAWPALALAGSFVIWSPRGGVLHAGYAGLRGRHLRYGRGYLPLSITRISGGNHACSAGAVARLAA